MKQSLWKSGVTMPQFEPLRGSHKTDVLIIGGGLCGVLCAHFLENAGVDYMLAEADTIGSGMTGNTTAKLTSQHGLIYDKLLSSIGEEGAWQYLKINEQALAHYRVLAGKIPCDFEEKDNYVYSVREKELLEREVTAANWLGFPAEFVEMIPLPFGTEGAVRFPNQGQFHPLKFLAGIARGLNIYEHTFLRELAPHRAWNETAEITADKIIVTTHFPFLNKHGGYFIKLYQHRSYVLALKNAPDVQGMYVDESKTGLSFRNAGELLLLGGGSHRTGKKGGSWQELRSFAVKHYPEAKEVCAWAAQDCMSLDGIPYIGQYAKGTPDLYVASGFNKWGMTSSMAAAMVLYDFVIQGKSEFQGLFSPSRSIWKSQLFLNGAQAAANLLTPSKKRCPHLGCALKWNPHEHSWDCPCHGSRFEEHGALIDNPATGDAHL